MTGLLAFPHSATSHNGDLVATYGWNFFRVAAISRGPHGNFLTSWLRHALAPLTITCQNIITWSVLEGRKFTALVSFCDPPSAYSAHWVSVNG